MSLSRRSLVVGLVTAPALHLAASRAEAAADLQAAIEDATRRGQSYRLPRGVTRTRGLTLPGGAHLVGASGGSTLRLVGDGPLLRASHVDSLRLEGVTFAGDPRGATDGGLAQFTSVPRLRIETCVFTDAARDGLRLERCGGRIAGNTINRIGRGGLFSVDAVGLEIERNIVEDCGDNGIQVWRWTQGYDGARIAGNRIRAIRTRSGGSGENGNAISIFRAGGVSVIGNETRDAAFSAVRNNSGRGVVISDNICVNSGETAIFAEFAFRDVTIANNRVEGAAAGISMTNLDHNGRGATCTGNIVRDIRPYVAPDGVTYTKQRGIHAEADARVAGNVVDGSPWTCIHLGWGPFLQNVTAEDNIVRNAPYGISASVAPGAGRCRVARNSIGHVGKAAIVAMRWDEVVADNLIDGCGKWAHLECADNRRI